MARYVVFLRGINVGGHNLVRMSALREAFESLGFQNVTTFKASGNVIFESSHPPKRGQLEEKISEFLAFRAAVIIRSMKEIQLIVELEPFGGFPSDSPKYYVTFMAEDPQRDMQIPVFSQKRDVELILRRNLDIFSISHPINGRRGFPNIFVESSFGVKATTRDWKTVVWISKLS